MNVWTVAAQKGGVGKTTTVINLAGALIARGESVLLIDLDPHGSLTGYVGLSPDTVVPNAYDLFEQSAEGKKINVSQLVHHCEIDGLDILPSSAALVAVERRFGQVQGMGLVIKRAVQQLRGQYTYCLLDCPPSLGILVVNALVTCELLVAPIQTEFLAVNTLDGLMQTVALISRTRGTMVPHIVVPTMFDQRTRASVDSLAQMRARKDILAWDQVIPIDTQLREASRRGQPLTLWQPYARASLAYELLLDRLIDLSAGDRLRKVG